MSHGGSALSVQEARRRILSELAPVSGAERVATREALNRVLHEDVHSPINVPGYDNSAMDGFAVRGDDLRAGDSAALRVVGGSLAGAPFHGEVGPGTCARITTGAPLPQGADTVVMQEDTEELGDDRIEIRAGQKPGANVRRAGEDLAAGSVALPGGRRLRAPDLGVLASLGCVELWVRRRLRVAFFSTGDELRGVGQPLEEGQIYDSNRYTLHAALTRLGVEVTDLGVIPDDRERLSEAFRAAGSFADAVVTSGGVSVGEADYVKEVLDQEGHVSFWKVALRPGKPLAYGRVGRALFFGLPGNPVSVAATHYQVVQPVLRFLAGEPEEALLPETFPVVAGEALRKRPGRTEYQRGILHRDDTGRLVVRSTGSQGSGQLSSMVRANCFIVLEEDRGAVEAGEEVAVQPFEGLL